MNKVFSKYSFKRQKQGVVVEDFFCTCCVVVEFPFVTEVVGTK